MPAVAESDELTEKREHFLKIRSFDSKSFHRLFK